MPPSLETPPNPAATPDPPQPPAAGNKLRSRRFGELEQHELVYLLDSLDDERSRSRFRESIYISLFFYIALAWFVLYGPRVLFHQPRIAPIQEDEHKPQMTYLETPPNLQKLLPKQPPKVLSDKTNVAQSPHPVPEKALRRAGEPTPKPAPPTPKPQQPTPQPQQQQQAPQQQAQTQPRPQPPAPQPRPQPNSAIPDAPRPNVAPSRPGSSSLADDLNHAAEHAVPGGHGQGGDQGTDPTTRHPGLTNGYEILSDTLGTDFGPYIARLLRILRTAWLPLIPDECNPPLSKEGMTLIRFTILPDGKLQVGGMHLDDSNHDRAIDMAAWGSITSSNPFPPLPADFKGHDLTLRIPVQHHADPQRQPRTLAVRASDRSARKQERARQLRGLLLLALAAVGVIVWRARATGVFHPGWWRF